MRAALERLPDSDVKDALQRGALLVNNQPASAEDNNQLEQCLAAEKALFARFYVVKLGKKSYQLVEVH